MSRDCGVPVLMLTLIALLAFACSSDDDDKGNKATGPTLRAPSLGGRTLPQGLRQPANDELQEVSGAANATLGRGWGHGWFTYDTSWEEYTAQWDWWDAGPRQPLAGFPASGRDSTSFKFYSGAVQDTVIWSWKGFDSHDQWKIVVPAEGGYRDVLDAGQSASGSNGSVEFLPGIVQGESENYDWYEWAWTTSDSDFTIVYTGVVDAYYDLDTIWVTMATFEMKYRSDGTGYICYFYVNPDDPLWVVRWNADGQSGTWTYGFESHGDWSHWSEWDRSWDDSWDEGWANFEDDSYDTWGHWWDNGSGSPLGSIPIRARNR